MSTDRGELLARLADAVGAEHPVRVAVDGPPAAGKTTLADELAGVLRDRGRPVVHATISSSRGRGANGAGSSRARPATSTRTTTRR